MKAMLVACFLIFAGATLLFADTAVALPPCDDSLANNCCMYMDYDPNGYVKVWWAYCGDGNGGMNPAP